MRKIRIMDHEISSTGDHIDQASPVDTEIELLVRETRAPQELVRTLYTTERAKLESTAKIKTYVAVLIRRRVKALLSKQQRA